MFGIKSEEAQLRELLEALLKGLEKQGFKFREEEKKELIQGVMNDLSDVGVTLSNDDLRDPKLQKNLSLALLGQSVNKEIAKNPNHDPESLFDCKKLFKFLLEKDPSKKKALRDDLKLEIKKLVNYLKQKLNENGKNISNDQVEQLAENIVKKLEEPGKTEEERLQPLYRLITAAAIFNGGIGKEGFECLVTFIPPNDEGLIDFSQGGGADKTFFGEQNTFEPGKEDPAGLEMFARINAISGGGILIIAAEGIADAVDTSPKPKPPGVIN